MSASAVVCWRCKQSAAPHAASDGHAPLVCINCATLWAGDLRARLAAARAREARVLAAANVLRIRALA